MLLGAGMLQPWPLAKMAFYENITAVLLCFCGSVTYHTFMAHHQEYHRWLLIDVRPFSLEEVAHKHLIEIMILDRIFTPRWAPVRPFIVVPSYALLWGSLS